MSRLYELCFNPVLPLPPLHDVGSRRGVQSRGASRGLCLETASLELGQGKDLEFSLITVVGTVLQLGRAGRPESI